MEDSSVDTTCFFFSCLQYVVNSMWIDWQFFFPLSQISNIKKKSNSKRKCKVLDSQNAL